MHLSSDAGALVLHHLSLEVSEVGSDLCFHHALHRFRQGGQGERADTEVGMEGSLSHHYYAEAELGCGSLDDCLCMCKPLLLLLSRLANDDGAYLCVLVAASWIQADRNLDND